jgi:hypothetical protein
MAQQSTQFPPGGQLLNWTPGFATGGSPIRGLKVDNTSGSWLGVQVVGLPTQYIPPYTLGWAMTFTTPLSNVTITSGGPPSSISTNSGSNVSVYAYSSEIAGTSGNTYYTPTTNPSILSINTGLGLAVSGHSAGALLPALPNKSYRLYNWSMNIDTFIIVRQAFIDGNISTPSGKFISYMSLTPDISGNTVDLAGIILPVGEGVNINVFNSSTTVVSSVNVSTIYSVI